MLMKVLHQEKGYGSIQSTVISGAYLICTGQQK